MPLQRKFSTFNAFIKLPNDIMTLCQRINTSDVA